MKKILSFMAVSFISLSFADYKAIIHDFYTTSNTVTPPSEPIDNDFLINKPISYMSAGGNASLYALDEDGSLWVSGINNSGQLGLGHKNNQIGWTNTNNTSFKKFFPGHQAAFAIGYDGTVWAVGKNDRGKTGLNASGYESSSWGVVTGLNTDIIDIQVANQFSLALDSSGNVWAAGSNIYGQLGTNIKPIDNSKYCSSASNDYDNSWQLSTTISDKNIVQISVGGNSAYALDDNGTVWAVGLNDANQFGVPTTYNCTYSWVNTGITNIKQIGSNQKSAFAVDYNDDLYVVGYGAYGNFGDGTTNNHTSWTKINTISNIKEISVGPEWTYALDNNGSLWVTGYNSHGYLGLGHTNNVKTWTKNTSVTDIFKVITSNYSYFGIILQNDGTILGTGYNTYGRLGNSYETPTEYSDWTLTEQPKDL